MALNDDLLYASHFNSGTATDWSGNGNTPISISATATADKNSVANQALDFDGVNDIVDLPAAVLDNYSTTDKTISFWAKFDSVSPAQALFMPDSNRQGPSFDIQLNGILYFELFDGTARRISSGTVTTNTWYHIVGVYRQNNNVELYIDKVSQGATSCGTVSYFSVMQVLLGNRPSNTWWFNGQMDEIRIWNRALSVAEITEVYNLYDSEGGVTPPTISPLILSSDL